MKAVPRRLLVLGGGSAGVELAQVVRRLGGEAVIVEGADRVLPREPRPLGQALSDALRQEGIELMLGKHATAARREGEEFVLEFDGAPELRGDRLLVATGRRPRVEEIGLETVGIEADAHGIRVDDHLRAGERLWAIGDVNGIWPLTHVGEYEGDVVAANIAGDPRPANYEAVPRVTYTDPQAASVGRWRRSTAPRAPVSEVPKMATYTHAYAESNGFLTLLSDGERLTGAYALGPEAGEWLQQATLAIRAHVPVEVLGDTIQPFPSFSGIYDAAVMALRMEIMDRPRPIRRHRLTNGNSLDLRKTMTTATTAAHTQHAPQLVGQTVVLIGGSAGIGLETARLARAEGAEVILAARDPERLKRAADDVGARSTAAFDATDTAALKQFFDGLPDPIDHVLVTGPGPRYAPLLEIDRSRATRCDDRPHGAGTGRGAERRRQDEARRHAAADGWHGRPTDRTRPRDRLRRDRRAPAIRGLAGARDRAGQGQPDRRRLRRYPAFRGAPRR